MKFLISQLSYFLSEQELRKNLRALLKYVGFLVAVIVVFSILFHVIMEWEGQQHSWLTGFYWTLTVMSTLGFGDITFQSDLGRAFSLLVLVSGIVLLLIMLPFTFIRYFYAPWLEAQIRARAPRAVPGDMAGHVIICRHDSIAPGLARKLDFSQIPYFVLEPDPIVAERMISDGISAVTGDIDSPDTYRRLRARHARMVFANGEDTVNTNIALTVRDVAPDVPIVALAENDDSVDILELSGANRVLNLKRRLGQQLATRVNLGAGSAAVIGRFKGLRLAEFAVANTPFAGKTLIDTRLRQDTGVSVIGVWERGHFQPVRPDSTLSDAAVPVVIGTREQLDRLNERLASAKREPRPVVIIGGGRVGFAAAGALRRRGVQVHVVDRDQRLARAFRDQADRFIVGDAADREVLAEAGLEEAGAVALTTNDDAVNIYLTVYCRRLQKDLHIASRITHERNLEAMCRAGADSVLSYSSLGREYVFSRLLGRNPIMVGEGTDFFYVRVPASIAGQPLAETRIGARTGLIVIALERGDDMQTNPGPHTPVPEGGSLLLLGTAEQRQAFAEAFER